MLIDASVFLRTTASHAMSQRKARRVSSATPSRYHAGNAMPWTHKPPVAPDTTANSGVPVRPRPSTLARLGKANKAVVSAEVPHFEQMTSVSQHLLSAKAILALLPVNPRHGDGQHLTDASGVCLDEALFPGQGCQGRGRGPPRPNGACNMSIEANPETALAAPLDLGKTAVVGGQSRLDVLCKTHAHAP